MSVNVQLPGDTATFPGNMMFLYCTSIFAAWALVSTSNGINSVVPENFVRPLSNIHRTVSLNSTLSVTLAPQPIRLSNASPLVRVVLPVVVIVPDVVDQLVYVIGWIGSSSA